MIVIVTKLQRETARDAVKGLLEHSVNRLWDAVREVDPLIEVGDTIAIGKQLREVHRLTMLAEKFNALYLEMKTDLLRAPVEPEELDEENRRAAAEEPDSADVVATPPLPPPGLTEEQTKRVDDLLAGKPLDEDLPF